MNFDRKFFKFRYSLKFIFIAMFVIFAMLMPSLNMMLGKYVDSIKIRLLNEIEKKINRKISYQYINPSILKTIGIGGLKIYRQREKDPELEIDRIEIKYHLLSLLKLAFKREKNPDDFISIIGGEMIIKNGYLKIDSQKDADLIGFLSKQNKNNPSNFNLKTYLGILSKNFQIKFENISLEYTTPQFKAVSKQNKFYISWSKKRLEEKGQKEDVLFFSLESYFGIFVGEDYLKTDVIFYGQLKMEEKPFLSGNLELKNTETKKYKIYDQILNIDLKHGLLQGARKNNDGIKLDFSYDILKDFLKTDLVFSNTPISNIFKPKELKNDPLGKYVILSNIHLEGSPKQQKYKIEGFFNESSGMFESKIKATKELDEIKVDELYFKNDLIYALFKGKYNMKANIPEGKLDVKTYKNGTINSENEVTFKNINGALDIQSKDTNYDQISVKSVNFKVDLSSKNKTASGYINLDSNNTIKVDYSNKKLKIKAEKITLSSIIGIFKKAKDLDVKPGISLTFSIDAEQNDKELTFGESYLSIFKEEKQFFTGKLEFSTQKEIFLKEINFDGKTLNKNINYTVQNASLNIKNLKNKLDIKLEIPSNLEKVNINGEFLKKEGLLLLQNENVYIKSEKQNNGIYGVIHLKNTKMPLLGEKAVLNSNLTFKYNLKNDWELKIDSVSLHGVSIFNQNKNNKTSEFYIKNSSINQSEINLANLEYKDEDGDFKGYLIGSIGQDDLKIKNDLMLKSKNGIIKGYFALNQDNEIFSSVFLQNIEATKIPFLGKGYSGKVNELRLNWNGHIFDPNVNLIVYAKEIKNSSEQPISLILDSNYNNGEIFLNKAQANINQNLKIDLSGSFLSFKEGTLKTIAEVKSLEKNGEDVFLNADFNFLTNQKKIDIDNMFFGIHGKGSLKNTKKSLYSNLNFQLNSDEEKIELNATLTPEVGQEKMFNEIFFVENQRMQNVVRAYLTKDKNFYIKIEDILPVSLEAIGKVYKDNSQNMIDCSIKNIKFDAGFFSPSLDVGVFKPREGRITEGRINLKGNLEDPNFEGYLRVQDFAAYLSSVLPSKIETKYAYAELNGKELVMKEMRGNLNGEYKANVNLSLKFKKYIPYDVGIEIETVDNKGVFIKENFNGVLVEASVRGNLEINSLINENKNNGLIMRGNLDVVNGKIDGRGKKTQSGPSDVDYDIDLNIKSQSEDLKFIYPGINTFVKSKNGIELIYDGEFGLRGNAQLVGGEIYYGNYFQIKKGQVYFNEYGDNFNPELELSANLKTIYNKRAANINLEIAKGPVSDISKNAKLSSDIIKQSDLDSLAGVEILGFSEQNEDKKIENIIKQGSNILESSTIKPAQNFIKKILNLDSFNIRTEILGNLAGGIIKEGSKERTSVQNTDKETHNSREIDSITTTTDNELAKASTYLDQTQLSLGKFLGNDVFLELNLQLQKNLLGKGNLGSDIDLTTQISMEWNSPFFLFKWFYSPDFNTIRNLTGGNFFMQNSISFSWDFLSLIEKKKKK